MGSVAEWKVGTVLALAEEGVSLFPGDKGLRSESSSFVGSVAKWLVRGVATSAEEVGFSLFEGHFNGYLGGYFWIWHDDLDYGLGPVQVDWSGLI